MRLIKLISKIFIVILSLFILLVIAYVLYFFIANDAPVIKGKVIKRVEYKQDLNLDIYFPTQQIYSQTPVVVYFHGGAWVIGNKLMLNLNRYNQAFNELRDHGYAIVCPNYTLANEDSAPFPQAINDAVDALRWVISNREQYNFDVKNIGIFAESAGAQIAMMLIFADEFKIKVFADTIYSINYFVDAYAPVDLNVLYNSGTIDHLQGVIQNFPNFLQEKLDFKKVLFDFDPIQDSLQTVNYLHKYSPLNYISLNVPPILMIHGVDDAVVPVNQTLLLKEKLDFLQIENEIYLLEGVNHVLRNATNEQRDSVQGLIMNFIEKNYKLE